MIIHRSLSLLAFICILIWSAMKFDCVGDSSWNYYLIPFTIFVIILYYNSTIADKRRKTQ